MEDINHTTHDAANTLVKMCQQAVNELIQLTNIKYSYEIKTVGGAHRLLDDMWDAGFIIYELQTDSAFKKTYVLQLNGKIIAQRDVCLEITAN